MKRRRGNEIFFVSPSASHNDALFCGSEDLILCSTNYAKKDEIEVYYLSKLAFKGETNFEQSSIGAGECETQLAKSQTTLSETQTNLSETQTNLNKTPTNLNEIQANISEIQPDLGETQINLGETQTDLSEAEAQTNTSKRVATLKNNESVDIISSEINYSSSDTNLIKTKTNKQVNFNGNETNIGENKGSLGESFEKNIENENSLNEKGMHKNDKTGKFKMLESFYQNKEFGKIEEFVKAFSKHTYVKKDYNIRYVNFKIEIVDKGIASNYKRVLDTKDASINTHVSLDENEIYRKVYVCQNNLLIKITSKNKKCSFRFEIEERENIKIEHNGRNEFKIFDGKVVLILSLKTDGEIVINKNGFQIEGSTNSVLNLCVPCFKAVQKENQEKEVKNTQVEFFLKNQDRSIEEQIFLFKQGEVPTNLIKNIFNYSCSLLKLLPFIIKATKYDYFFDENASLKEQKANLSDKNCNLSKENVDFCAGIGGLDSENGGLNEENPSLDGKIGGLGGEKGGLGGEKGGLGGENGCFYAGNASLDEENASLNEENPSLDGKKGDSGSENGGFYAGNCGLTNENGGLSGNKESLGDENVGAHNEEKSLRKENGVFKNFSFNKVNYDDAVYSLLSLLYTKKDETGFIKEYILDIVKNTDKYRIVSKNLYDKDGLYLLKGIDDLLVLDKNGASLIVLFIYEYFKVTGDEEIIGLSFDFIRGVYEFYNNFFTKSVTGTYESSFGVLGNNLCCDTGNKLAHSLASDFASARVVFVIYKKCLEILHKGYDDSLQEKLQAIPSLEVSSGGIIKEYQTNLITPKSTNCEIDFLFPFNFGVRKIDTTSDYDMVVSNSAKHVFMSAVGGFSSSEVLKIVLLLLTCGDIKSGNTIMNILLKVFLKSNLTFQNDDVFNFGLGRIGKANENEFSFVQNYIFIRLIYNMFLSSTSNKLYINGTFLEGFSKLRLSNYSVDSALKVQEVVNVKRRVLKLELYSLKDRNLTLVLPKNMKRFKIRGEYVFDASHNSLNISLVKNKKRKLKIILSK